MKKGLVLMGVLLLSFLFLGSCTQGNEKEPWIVGFWAFDRTHAPHTIVIEIKANGTYDQYENYACSGAPIDSGTWSLEGDELTMGGNTGTITPISDDEFYVTSYDMTFFRKGTEPGGNIFDQSETVLSEGVWSDGNLPYHELKLYSFTASSAGDYTVSWEDQSDGGGYTGDVLGCAYRSDQATLIFLNQGNNPSQPVTLAAGEKIFPIVDAFTEGGTYRIKVQ
jgi:hypothetical protein